MHVYSGLGMFCVNSAETENLVVALQLCPWHPFCRIRLDWNPSLPASVQNMADRLYFPNRSPGRQIPYCSGVTNAELNNRICTVSC